VLQLKVPTLISNITAALKRDTLNYLMGGRTGVSWSAHWWENGSY
jgi:hypothetical protein